MAIESFDDTGFRSLFDGATLAGWHAAPRVYGALYPGGPSALTIFDQRGVARPVAPEEHPAAWHVEDGHIVGQQSGGGYGGYLVSDAAFGDFELVLEARPDWPADTGIMVRRLRDDWTGFQVLLDHRESGGIGGFFGNGLGSFSALPFAIRAVRDAAGEVIGIEADDPETSRDPVTPGQIARLDHAASVADFLRVWKWAEWNEIRIRCTGALPRLTTWVNGLRIAELDTATLVAPNYDPAAVLGLLGTRGHLALEVHDSGAFFPQDRWGEGARCRWRNIRIKTFDKQEVRT